MGGKSNVIKRNVENVWGARYLPKNTVVVLDGYLVYTFFYNIIHNVMESIKILVYSGAYSDVLCTYFN
jgi:hypothetical protein